MSDSTAAPPVAGPRSRLAAAVLAALIAIPALTSVAMAASATYSANCSVNLRASTSTSAGVLDVISSGTIVTASGSVNGGSWSAGGCAGNNGTGSTWYAITAVNGQSTASLYGRSTVYAATGLFSAYTPPPPPPPANYLTGVDVSTWQGSPNYALVYGAGYRFVVAKASEGIGYTDPKWAYNRSAVPAAGLRLSGYHFARPDLNSTTAGATGEADWFVSQLGLSAGMLPPALDLEVAGSLNSAQLVAWVQAWLGEVYAKTHVHAMIYVSPAFWSGKMANSQWFAQNGYTILWVAHWTTASQPSVPANNWAGHGWTFWQYADNGTVPGISGGVDMDRYNGLDLTPVTYGADFALALPSSTTQSATSATSPAPTVSVKQGSRASASVAINRTWFTLPVSVTVSGLPATITASATPSSTASNGVSLTVSASTATPVGTYPFTVTGSANGVSRSVSGSIQVTDGLPPTVHAPVTRLLGGIFGSTAVVQTSWSATDPSGVAGYGLDREANGGAWGPVTLSPSTRTSINEALSVGPSYRYTVRAVDGASNVSPWLAGPAFRLVPIQQTSSAISYGGVWRSQSMTTASGGSLAYAVGRGAWASYAFMGDAIGWVAYRGPDRGSAVVYIDGKYVSTVNLYASTYLARPIVFSYNWSGLGAHTIRIVVAGTVGHPRVDLDGFVRLLPG